MPLYEFVCPRCGSKFEELRSILKGRNARCPECNRKSYRVPSIFSWKWFNGLTLDGEGYTSRFMRHEEVAEQNKECRDR